LFELIKPETKYLCHICKKPVSRKDIVKYSKAEIHDMVFFGISFHEKCFQERIKTFPTKVALTTGRSIKL
jgi:hypothetical protein